MRLHYQIYAVVIKSILQLGLFGHLHLIPESTED